jgi:hypothetical protein
VSRRRHRAGTGAIIREIRALGDRVVTAIQEAGAGQEAGRARAIAQAAEILRATLQEGALRAVVVDPGTGRSVLFTGNDTGDAPPESGRRG